MKTNNPTYVNGRKGRESGHWWKETIVNNSISPTPREISENFTVEKRKEEKLCWQRFHRRFW